MARVVYALFLHDEPDRVRYVGQTVCAPCRLRAHVKDSQHSDKLPVQRWVRKHGEDAIGQRIVWTSGDDETLNEAETFWISMFRADGHDLLNVSTGGESGSRGTKWTDEMRAHASSVQQGRKKPPRTEEFKLRKSEEKRRFYEDPEERRSASENLKKARDARGVRGYTEEEDALILACSSIAEYQELGAKLGRTWTAVSVRRCRLRKIAADG